MSALLRLIWSICCLRAGPADMPYSPVLLCGLVICEFLLSWYQLALYLGEELAVIHASVLLGVFIAFIYVVMLGGKKTPRFIQTATTLVAVNVFMDCLHLPILILSDQLLYQGQAPILLILFTIWMLIYIIALNIWLIMATAHVFSRALDAPFTTGLLVTVAMLGVNVVGFAFLSN